MCLLKDVEGCVSGCVVLGMWDVDVIVIWVKVVVMCIGFVG